MQNYSKENLNLAKRDQKNKHMHTALIPKLPKLSEEKPKGYN
jgi:hypothetical protein